MAKLRDKVRGWAARNLTYAGRLCLIKSILNSILRFWASIMFIPNAVLEQVQSVCRDYLWSGNSEKHYYPVSWLNVCQPKEEGGLDMKEVLAWNKALMSKYIMELARSSEESDSLWLKWNRSYRLGDGTV